jgi:hypothetical protein
MDIRKGYKKLDIIASIDYLSSFFLSIYCSIYQLIAAGFYFYHQINCINSSFLIFKTFCGKEKCENRLHQFY